MIFFTTRAPVVLIITSIKWHLWIDLYTIWEIWPSLWQSAELHFPINPNGGIGRKKNLSKGRRTKPMQRDWQNSLSISSCFLLFPTLLPSMESDKIGWTCLVLMAKPGAKVLFIYLDKFSPVVICKNIWPMFCLHSNSFVLSPLGQRLTRHIWRR